MEGSATLPASEWLFLPLTTARGPVGLLGVSFETPKRQLTPEQRYLLEVLVDQVAVAIERTRLATDIEDARLLTETERLRSPLHARLVEASIRQFCASARARFEACADFDAKRQFLVDHVERLIYNRYKVAIAGSVAVESASGESKLQFRIEGEIDGRRYVRGRDRYVRKLGGGRSAGASRSCNSAQTKRSAAFRAL